MIMAMVLGVDPGANGAVAALDQNGQLLWVEDIPSTPRNGKMATNAPLLAAIIAKASASIVFCEFVGARPEDGRVSAFAFAPGAS
jgi:outer membrane protein assembly factor BamB